MNAITVLMLALIGSAMSFSVDPKYLVKRDDRGRIGGDSHPKN
jgi:hypothetical protein